MPTLDCESILLESIADRLCLSHAKTAGRIVLQEQCRVNAEVLQFSDQTQRQWMERGRGGDSSEGRGCRFNICVIVYVYLAWLMLLLAILIDL